MNRLEKKIWSIWNEHPTNNKLTDKARIWNRAYAIWRLQLCTKSF